MQTANKLRLKKKVDSTPAPKSQLAFAILQERQGDRDEARRSYEKVLASDARSVDAIIGLARLDQLAGRAADAEAGFQKAIRIEPRTGRTLDALGQFYVDQKRWNEAVATLQSATSAAPDDKSFRFHYAIALAKSGQIEQAVPQLVDAVGSAAAHYNIGLVLHERGDLAASEDEFSAALLENPRLQQAQYWLTEVRHERELAMSGTGKLANGAPPSAAIIAQRTPGSRNPAADRAALPPAVPAGTSTGSTRDVQTVGAAAGQWNNQR